MPLSRRRSPGALHDTFYQKRPDLVCEAAGLHAHVRRAAKADHRGAVIKDTIPTASNVYTPQ